MPRNARAAVEAAPHPVATIQAVECSRCGKLHRADSDQYALVSFKVEVYHAHEAEFMPYGEGDGLTLCRKDCLLAHIGEATKAKRITGKGGQDD